EQCRRRIQRRRIARPQLAVDFDQRFLRRLHRIALEGLADYRAHVVALGEEQVELDNTGLENLRYFVGSQLGVSFEQNFAGGGVDDIARHPCAFEVRDVDLDLADLCFLNFLQSDRIDLASGVRDFLARLRLDAVRQLHAQQVGRLLAGRIKRPVKLVIADDEPVHGIERAENVFAGTQAEGAQENRAQELTLAVDANVEHVFLVVLEFNPRSAVRNDLAQEVGTVVRGFEENAGRAVQLADDHALGAVHDERPIVGHQRHVAEEHFLFLDVTDGAVAGLGILLENGETHRDLERRGVSHAALLALAYVILQLQSDGVAALVAEVGGVCVVGAALRAQHIAGMKRIGNDGRAAVFASGAQVMQTFEVSALALPVADGEVHKLQLRHVAEIANRKYRLKYGLQAGVVALAGQPVHLQEAFVGTLL